MNTFGDDLDISYISSNLLISYKSNIVCEMF